MFTVADLQDPVRIRWL